MERAAILCVPRTYTVHVREAMCVCNVRAARRACNVRVITCVCNVRAATMRGQPYVTVTHSSCHVAAGCTGDQYDEHLLQYGWMNTPRKTYLAIVQ